MTVTGYSAQFMGLVFVVLGLIAMTVPVRSLSSRLSVQALVLLVFLVLLPLIMQVALGKV